MENRILKRLTPVALGAAFALTGVSVASAADWAAERVYSYRAPVYDDVPAPLYYAPLRRERVYHYVPVVRERRVYSYSYAPPVVPRRRVYGYGPVYGYAPAPAEVIVVERRDETRPLGVYAPLPDENLSESRRFFRAITRQSGGH